MTSPYPLQERPLRLPSGRMVTVLNLVVSVADGLPGGSFVVQYRTSTPAIDIAARRAEADEIVELHRGFADTKHLDTIRAEICNTEAAAQMREAPEAWFSFTRTDDGSWMPDEEGP